MKAKVILNPYANRWKSLSKKDEVINILKRHNINFELEITKYPGHGTTLAQEAVFDDFDLIIAAGGDGNISEVVNGIALACEAKKQKVYTPLGILPLGSANDLARNLCLPIDLNESAAIITGGHTRLLDLGRVNGRYFDNNSAIGLEPTITLIQQKITRVRGIIRYLLATLIGILRNPTWMINLEWDTGSYSGPVNLVTVGNNPLTGGLFYMTPHADPYDGKLTFVFGYINTRLKIIKILPRTMKPKEGSYVEHPDINELHAEWIRINIEPGSPLHADGEIQAININNIYYEIVPAVLPILMPI